MGVSVLLSLFISNNEVCNTAMPSSVYMSRTPFSKIQQWPNDPKGSESNNLHYGEVQEDICTMVKYKETF